MRKLTTLIRLSVALLLLAAVFQAQVPAAQSSECIEGRFKNVSVGPICSCPDGLSTPKDRYQCINGVWEYLYSFCGAPFCPDGGGGGGSCQEQLGSCPYEPNMYCPPWCVCCY